MNSPSFAANRHWRRLHSSRALFAVALFFLALAGAFMANLWGQPDIVIRHPLVDTNFLDTATIRNSYADLARLEEDISGFDCYACHEKGKPLPIQYDADHKILIPKEHENIVMRHGRHERNNNCYNCHNEANLELLYPRDGRELKWTESTQLCGSCHGPTFRDWEAGVHGRVNGFWRADLGKRIRKDCVNCHDPHAPKVPGRKPAPPPLNRHGDPKPAHVAQSTPH
jgi:hypothetical protein